MIIVARLILIAFSYATTLLAAIHVLRPGEDATALAVTAAVALAVEAALYGMKEAWFKGGSGRAVSVLGFVIDGLVNTGGALTFTGRLLTFGPIALTIGLTGLSVADPTVNLIGTIVLGVVLGFGLSVAPHLLGRVRTKS